MMHFRRLLQRTTKNVLYARIIARCPLRCCVPIPTVNSALMHGQCLTIHIVLLAMPKCQTRDHLKKSCSELLLSWLSVLTSAMIKFVTYSPPEYVCSVFSSAGTPAPLIEPQSACNGRLGIAGWVGVLEVWIWTYYGIVLQWRCKYSYGLETAPKYAFCDNNETICGVNTGLGRGRSSPSPLHGSATYRRHYCYNKAESLAILIVHS